MSENTHSHHILPLKVYFIVAGALFIFTAITVWVATQFHLNLFVALLIATIKASLVALYFMHLKYDNKLYLTLLVMSLVFLSIFIGLTMLDTMFRGIIDPRVEGQISNEAVIYQNK
jgi:cytochrome c oxidase subunit IV